MRTPRTPAVLATLALLLTAGPWAPDALADSREQPIPVIYDTDLGEDIDDAWALAFAVRCPELDVKLVTINFGGVRYKAPMVAKLLTALGRDDIPIAIGESNKRFRPRYFGWAEDYDLDDYAGELSEDAVSRMIEVIEADETGRLKILAVGSMLNVAGVLKKRPEVAERLELVAMSGHVRTRPDMKLKATTNVRIAVAAAKRVYRADWERFTIAPSNVTSRLHLAGERYEHVHESDAAGIPALIKAYEVFMPNAPWIDVDVTRRSSTLHDCVAVYLAFADQYLRMERFPLRVAGKGYTRIDRMRGEPVHVAVEWKNRDAFLDLLVKRLTGSLPADGS